MNIEKLLNILLLALILVFLFMMIITASNLIFNVYNYFNTKIDCLKDKVEEFHMGSGYSNCEMMNGIYFTCYVNDRDINGKNFKFTQEEIDSCKRIK